ncbi:MAG: RNA polymerase sigma factor [Flavobacteriaceae bacterium]|nr:RNA polymerase sigma factor [Flavobacteriaceae bacterium]
MLHSNRIFVIEIADHIMKRIEFIQFCEDLKPMLYRMACNMLISKDEAKDAVQDVFLKLWKNKSMLDSVDNPSGYAVQTLKNRCKDILKSKSAQNLRIVHWRDSAENTTQTTEFNADYWVGRVLKMLEKLPVQQQQIFRMRELEGFEYEEIATYLGLKEATVRMNLSRARSFIKEQLKEAYFNQKLG